MTCRTCGNAVSEEARFCPNCGTGIAAPPPRPAFQPAPPAYRMPAPRVQRHLQTLGVLWCVFGAFRVLGGLVAIFFLRVATLRSFGSEGWPFFPGDSYGPSWLQALVPVIAVYTAVMVALAFFVGFSLLTRKPWGRTLAIVAALLALLRPLFGTALGAYTLWVLAPATSGQEYDGIAHTSWT